MKDLVAASRYAQAVFEIAYAAKEDQAVEDELQSFSQALKAAPELEAFLMNPSFSLAQKTASIAKIYPKAKSPSAKILASFLPTLLKKGRFPLIHEIADAYKRISDLAQGEAIADVTTAVPLAPAAEARLLPALEKAIGAKIVLRKKVDPALVGGITVRVRNKVFDGSVLGQLKRLKSELTQKQSL